MPKRVTPYSVQLAKKKEKQKGKVQKTGPWIEIWVRLKRNKMAVAGMIILFLFCVCALCPRLLTDSGYDDQNYAEAFQFPNWKHPFGTDNLGRDILTRIIYGSRISLVIGLCSVTLGLVVGGLLGAAAAFYSGKTDNIIMRIMDILIALPSFLLAIAIAAALGPSMLNVIVAIAFGSIPNYARVTRASILTVKDLEYIEAARAIGSNDRRIIFKHLIPNALAPIIVQATLGVAGAIISAAGLSFIGLGVQPPTPEWGAMLSAGKQYIRTNWNIVTFPGLTIMLSVFALNLLGDGLRDALDPKMKR